MTAVAITSESATSAPSAPSQLNPDRVANVLGIADEADRDGDGEEQGNGAGDRPFVVTAVASPVGDLDRLEDVGGLAVVVEERSSAELARVRLTSPGHHDHEGEGEHPGRHPDPHAQHDTEHRPDLAKRALVFLGDRRRHEAAEDEQQVDAVNPCAPRSPLFWTIGGRACRGPSSAQPPRPRRLGARRAARASRPRCASPAGRDRRARRCGASCASPAADT